MLLRQDNADLRLTEFQITSAISNDRLALVEQKEQTNESFYRFYL